MKATFGWLVWRLRLRKINNHARAIFGVPDNVWEPWAHDRDREEVERFVRGEYEKAENHTQRAFVAYFGCSVDEAGVMEKNIALAFEKAMGEKAEDLTEFLPNKRATPILFVDNDGETVNLWCPRCRLVHVPPACGGEAS